MRVSDGKGNGNGSGEDAFELAVGEVPAEIFELAESCRRFAFTAVGVPIDYDAETLPILDQYLATAGTGIKDREELLPLVARAVGAYFGEVLRRKVDSFWRRRDDPNDEWELCARRALFSLSPYGIVLDALARGEDHPGPSGGIGRLGPEDEELAEQRLARLPPVSEEEFYLLSTRLEVIETVYEAIRERMKEEGRESLVYDEDDYEE